MNHLRCSDSGGSSNYPCGDILLERLPLGVVFQNRQGEITAANAAAERILGLSLDQIESEQDDHVIVRFVVRDTGIGIAPDDLPKLFSAFEQVDNTITRQYGGTGLGLAITHKLAQLMAGDAGAESTLGQGSTFWFTAQLKKARRPGDRVASSTPGSAERVLIRDYAGRRILLVEDEPINREVTESLLSDIGLITMVAEDGVAAVELATRS